MLYSRWEAFSDVKQQEGSMFLIFSRRRDACFKCCTAGGKQVSNVVQLEESTLLMLFIRWGACL
jgi:hypothetical protein